MRRPHRPKTPAAPQTLHTYFFVPESSGAGPTPGAYFRLGAYSDIENNASDLSKFYPRQHSTDEDGNALANSVGGGKGIVLACSGRILIHAGEKVYIHSAEAMHIDTEDTFTLNADNTITVTSGDEIFITSGTNKNITIDAGGTGTVSTDSAGSGTSSTSTSSSTGTVNVSAKTQMVTIFGESTEKVTKDKYTYFQADSYTIQMGTQNTITLGGKFSIWIGASITFNLAIDLVLSAATAFTLYVFKFEFGFIKIDLVKLKIEYKDGKLTFGKWQSVNHLADIKAHFAKSKTAAVTNENKATSVDNKGVDSANQGVQAENGGATVWVKGVINAV